MRVFRFVKEEHEEYGNEGWRLESQPGFDPVGGMAVAHDVLEHFSDTTDSAHDELMALGAWFFTRSEHYGYLKYPGRDFNRRDMVSPLSGDLMTTLQHVWDGNVSLAECPKKVRLNDPEVNKKIWENIQGFISETGDHTYYSLPSKQEARNIYRWMAKGYQRAKRRFRDWDSFRISELFIQIEKEADRLRETADIGEVLVVRMDFKNLDAKLYLDRPWDRCMMKLKGMKSSS